MKKIINEPKKIGTIVDSNGFLQTLTWINGDIFCGSQQVTTAKNIATEQCAQKYASALYGDRVWELDLKS